MRGNVLTGESTGAARPKAYLVAQVAVHDAEAFAAYTAKVPGLVERFGGRYAVRGGATVLLDGDTPPSRTVIIEFPSLDAATAFYDSPDYRAILPLRLAAAGGTVFLVEGVPC